MSILVEHVLARRGIGGHRQYRIPALAVSPRGTILAAYDGRPNLDDLPNPIDLLLRRSTDNGRSWGPQQTVRTGTGLDGYGDPSLLIDTETGRIFMFHAAGTHAGFFESVEGLDREDDIQHADLSFSDDDGITWHHRRLTTMLKRAGITGLFAAAGAGIRVHAGPYTGRLVQQFVVLFNGKIMAASAYSDDHGDTWTLGELIPGANENKVAVRSDGSLLLHSRATPRRLTAVSTDGGQSYSPAEPHPGLPDPSDNGSLCRFDGLPNVTTLVTPETGTWLLATHNHDPFLRRNTVLKLSQDDGVSWPFAVALCPGSSAYSTAARLPDGRIGVLYERQGYQEIVFAALDPKDLLSSPAASLTHDGGTTDVGSLSLDVVLRSVTPSRPDVWRSTGESFTLTQTDGEWDAAAWKEVGQGYTEETPQVLSNRESQDLNYGPIIEGYKAGDVLAFSGRLANAATTTAPLAAVTLGQEILIENAPLAPGESRVFTATYTVTAADLAAGSAAVTFELAVAGALGTAKGFTFDMRTGDVAEN